jgi:hypothetical protein
LSIEQQLHNYLANHAPLTDKIGADKVFFVQAPQGTEYDYVVLTKISGNRLRKIGFGFPLFQISYFSQDKYRALEGAEIIIQALDGYSGSWGTLYVIGNYQDDSVLVDDGVFHAPVEIRINHLEVS